MQLLYAVIDDLYQFALEASMRVVRGEKRPPHPEFLPQHPGATYPEENISSDAAENRVEEPIVPAFKSVEHILSEEAQVPLSLAKHTVMYVGTVSVPLYQNPTLEFDAAIQKISYGEMVMVLDVKGRFSRIAIGGTEGWVLREDLVDRAAYVYPEFTIGVENDVDDPNTVRVRAMLSDEFGGALVGYPLQAGEYVSYRLMRKGLRIAWPKVRPRVPGLWHTILKGISGIHMGISPKTGSIMEYMISEDVGHLAYVEAVFPDETITITEVNFPHGGIYNERVLTRDEWRELRPTFIQVS